MKDRYTSKEPLMYIAQSPKIHPPKVDMQAVYSIKKEKRKSEQAEETEREITASGQDGRKALEIKKTKKKKIHYLDDFQHDTGVFGKPLNKEKDQETEKKSEERKEDQTMNPPGPYLKKVKSFREMDTLERLEYLLHFPKQLPPVPCLFQTKNQSIRGYVKGKTEDGQIEVLLFNKNVKTLPVEDIQSVRIIGMR